MSDNERSGIFRKNAIDRISTPEDLTDYLKVTNHGIWIVLVAVIVLLVGIFVWSCTGTLETTADATVIVADHKATVALKDSDRLEEGMTLRVSSEDVTIADLQTDEYGRTTGRTEVDLPDGTYEGTVVIEQTHPISFLFDVGSI